MTITLERRNALLDEAKALVLKGWCQGRARTDNEVCAYGAVTVDIHLPSADMAAIGGAWRALKIALAKLGLGTSVFEYNDAPGRTKYEVAAIFDHAKLEPL